MMRMTLRLMIILTNWLQTWNLLNKLRDRSFLGQKNTPKTPNFSAIAGCDGRNKFQLWLTTCPCSEHPSDQGNHSAFAEHWSVSLVWCRADNHQPRSHDCWERVSKSICCIILLMLFQDLLCPLSTSSYGRVMSSPFPKANQRHSQLRQSRILWLWLESDPSLKKHPCTEYQNNGSSAKEGKLLWIARSTFCI